MVDYLLAEERDLIYLPEGLSYADGAQVGCGFGTVYEGLQKIGISGNDCVLPAGTVISTSRWRSVSRGLLKKRARLSW
jgi:D-arabinose 1-dehydrogenase-like Zn-dependent alcohol dehydrogenase